MRPSPRAMLMIVLGGLWSAGAGCVLMQHPQAQVERMTAASARAELGCMPLRLEISDGTHRRWGSGVAIHPRVVVTAGHVLPDWAGQQVEVPTGAGFLSPRRLPPVLVDTGERAQRVRVRQVVRGESAIAGAGDWALLVLSRPLRETVVLPPASWMPTKPGSAVPQPQPGPRRLRGRAVVIAGFCAGQDEVGSAGSVAVRTSLVVPPPGASEAPLLYASMPGRGANFAGLSGAPVFCRQDDGTHTLVGIYLGECESRLAGLISLGCWGVIHQFPVAEALHVLARVQNGRGVGPQP